MRQTVHLMTEFKPHRRLIIVPRQTSQRRQSVFTEPYTVMGVEYYARGCWRALHKVGSHRTFNGALAMAWDWEREHQGETVV